MGEKREKDYTKGYRWDVQPGLVPSLLSATEVRGPYPGVLNRVQIGCWIMDYEFTAHGRWKLADATMMWRKRFANTVHLYTPETPIIEDTRTLRGTRHSAWLLFTGGYEAGIDRLLDKKKQFAEFLDPDCACGQEFLKIAQIASSRKDAGFAAAQACLWRLLDLLMSAEYIRDGLWRVSGTSSVVGPSGSTLAEKVDAILDSITDRRPSLPEVAAAMHISISQLAHRYRRETGMSPLAAWRQRKVRQASLLIAKGFPLKAAADQLGFCDAFHLSKVFKKVMGVSPKRYLQIQSRREAFQRGSKPCVTNS